MLLFDTDQVVHLVSAFSALVFFIIEGNISAKIYGGFEMQLNLSWPRHLVVVSCQLEASAALLSGKKPPGTIE
jgi:hypothetical protein